MNPPVSKRPREAGRHAGATAVVRVACAQLAARELEDSERSLEDALAAISEAARARASLVVLPECTYPAYILAEPVTPTRFRDDDEVERLFATSAREHGISVAVGLAQRWRPGDGGARNAAVLFGPDGEVRLRTAKRFLWDFDAEWFAPGSPSDPVRWVGPGGEEIGSVGMLVCADARMPEIARSLAVAGARLILDPTAWVATGRDPTVLSNPQPEYLMSVRALENGVWIAAADKVGLERGTVVYAGSSGVFAPDGSVVAMATSDEPEIVVADVDLSQATGPPVARRPELYRRITDRTEVTQAFGRVTIPVVPQDVLFRLGLLQSAAPSDVTAVREKLGQLATTVHALGLDVLAAVAVAGEPDVGGAADAGAVAEILSKDLNVAAGVAVTDGQGSIRAFHVVANGSRLDALPTHGSSGDPAGSLASRTIDIGPLRLAAVVGAEGLVPEVARVVCLDGAELVLWAADAGTPLVLEVARVRAVENRVWVALLVPASQGDDVREAIAAVIDPDGRVGAIGLRGRDHLVTAMVNVASARLKQMAPGTDVLADRQPGSYSILVHAEGNEPT